METESLVKKILPKELYCVKYVYDAVREAIEEGIVKNYAVYRNILKRELLIYRAISSSKEDVKAKIRRVIDDYKNYVEATADVIDYTDMDMKHVCVWIKKEPEAGHCLTMDDAYSVVHSLYPEFKLGRRRLNDVVGTAELNMDYYIVNGSL